MVAGKKAAQGRGRPERDEGIGARNRELIRGAATALFARKGYDGVRVAEIAAEAGLPKANVYYYFGSKDALYHAVLRHLMEGWTEALETLQADRDPLQAIAAYVRAKLAYSRDHADESRVFANEILAGAPRLSHEDRRYMQEVTHRHASVLEGWMSAGRLRRVDARHLLISIWATTQYYSDFGLLAADALDRPDLRAADFDAAAETQLEILLTGLRPEA